MKQQGILRQSIVMATGLALALPGAVQADKHEKETFSTEYESIRLVQVAGGLSHPWSLAILPDGRYLVSEKEGRLQLIEDGNKTEISGVPEVSASGQGGLLDVVLHPDYEDNGWIYFTWSKATDGSDTRTVLSRARLDGDALADWEDLFQQDRASSPGRHYGSRLAWHNDGTLLMSIGDRGTEPERAQDRGDHAGAVLRLTETGEAAGDNPFVNDEGVLPEIYSYGHRNIQGMIVNPDNGEIWVTEHGPRGGDELNLVQAGNNYGWPVAGKGRDYGTEEIFGDTRSKDTMTDPVHEFLPTHAPSGLALITADTFSAWEGNLMAGGLRSERIRRVVLEDQQVVHEEELLLKAIGRIRDVREGPEGHIYVLNDEEEAGLYRIEPD